MALFINAVEEIVAKQAAEMIAQMDERISSRLRPSEVIAYALNRLPPMYATSREGFSYLRNKVITEMSGQIYETLQLAVQRVLLGDPLYDPTPIPDSFFTDSASVLNRLCQVFNREQMRWRDVAIAVQSAVFKITTRPAENLEEITEIQVPDDSPSGGHPRLRAEMAGLKSYLRRARAKQRMAQQLQGEDQTIIQTGEYSPSGWKQDTVQAYSVMIAHDELVLYLLRPRLKMVNVTEQLVMLAIQKINTPQVHEGNRPAEIAAYALNRLPPMYATSWNGYNISRQRGINELSKDIILAVRNAALKILQSPPVPSTSPFATDFETEAQETLQNIRRIMDRDDIDLSNVVQVVQEFLSS